MGEKLAPFLTEGSVGENPTVAKIFRFVGHEPGRRSGNKNSNHF